MAGESELSIEGTNKLRLSLGLKPLKVDNKPAAASSASGKPVYEDMTGERRAVDNWKAHTAEPGKEAVRERRPDDIKKQALKAARALLKHISTAPADKNTKPNLLEDPENPADSAIPLWLQLATKKYITDTKKLKPLRIAIPHALLSPATTTVCLIVKDPQRHFKDLVTSAGLSSVVTRVIGVGKLRKKYKAYENRRQLLGSHDVFLADDRIITMLPTALGKAFYRQTSKIPLPVPLAAGNDSPTYLKNQVEKALNSTYVHLSLAATTSIRVALSSMTPEQVVENIVRVVEDLTSKKVPGGWKNVMSLHIKSPTSASLPIYMAADVYGEEDVLTPREEQERALALANKTAERKVKKNERKNAKRKGLSETKPVEEGEKEAGAETPKKKKAKVVAEKRK